MVQADKLVTLFFQGQDGVLEHRCLPVLQLELVAQQLELADLVLQHLQSLFVQIHNSNIACTHMNHHKIDYHPLVTEPSRGRVVLLVLRLDLEVKHELVDFLISGRRRLLPMHLFELRFLLI